MVEFKPRDTLRAQELRNQATPYERTLWGAINRRQISGAKFSRQMPVGPYFCDFLCRDLTLVVELDGYSHDLRIGHDRVRDAFMIAEGYQVLRFSNEDVRDNLGGVVQQIEMVVVSLQNNPSLEPNRPTPNPSRKREGDMIAQPNSPPACGRGRGWVLPRDETQ